MKRAVLLIALLPALATSACKSTPRNERKDEPGAAKAVETPFLFAERGVVLENVEAGLHEHAERTLATAGDSADVSFLRAKLALAKGDADLAYRELKKAVEKAPGWPEYQYELGTVAPLPVEGLTLEETKQRHVEAGRALARAAELKPDEPRYLYARAFFLSVEPRDVGGDPAEGKRLFDRIVERWPESAAAHRVLFDRAAQEESWKAAEEHAAKVGEKDAKEGARLWLQLAGTYLGQTTAKNRKESLERTRAALENAARLHPPAAGGFCDAGFALDGGGNAALADPFWSRCLELNPDGAKAAQARARMARRTPSTIRLDDPE